jgi:hypothetical protein
MKIYGVSTTKNGAITNDNYTNIAAAGTDNGVPYHYWYPVEIPSGTNSLFKGITTAEVDAVVTPYSLSNTDNSASLVQERMVLIHNNENKTHNQVRVFISDQQLTGSVAEITPWNLAGTEEIKSYASFEVLSSAVGNLSATNVFIKANFLTIQTTTPEVNKELVLHNVTPYSWHVAALRLYVVKDQSVQEDYCVIATETA